MERPGVSRRVNRGAWIAAAVLVLLMAVAAVLHSPWLSLSSIELVGTQRSSIAERVAASGVGEGAVLIWVDTDEVESFVAEDPWVADVRAQRIFPDRLVVEVLEREPRLWVEGVEGWMLVASDGTVLERADAAGNGLLVARIAATDLAAGTATDDRVWREVVDFAAVVPPDLVAGRELGYRAGDLWLVLPDFEVRLGNPIDLAEKGRVLVEMVAAGVPTGATVELVSPERPAVAPALPPLVDDPQPVVEGDTAEP